MQESFPAAPGTPSCLGGRSGSQSQCCLCLRLVGFVYLASVAGISYMLTAGTFDHALWLLTFQQACLQYSWITSIKLLLRAWSYTWCKTHFTSCMQENGHVESHRVSSATQTESPNSKTDGELSSMNLSDLSLAVPAASIQGPAGPSDSSAAFVPQGLYKEPSLAVTGDPEMHPGPQAQEPPRACEPMLSPVREAESPQEQAGRSAAAAQTEAVAIPGRGSRA